MAAIITKTCNIFDSVCFSSRIHKLIDFNLFADPARPKIVPIRDGGGGICPTLLANL